MCDNSHVVPLIFPLSDLDQSHYSKAVKFGSLLDRSTRHMNFLVNVRTCLVSGVFEIVDSFRMNNKSLFGHDTSVPAAVDSCTPWADSCHRKRRLLLLLPLQNCP